MYQMISHRYPHGANAREEDFYGRDQAHGGRASSSWREEQVDDPFEDPKVRQCIAELIIRAVVRTDRYA